VRKVLVDARGQRCPLPIIRLAEAVRNHQTAPTSSAAGSLEAVIVTLLADDPAARHDVAAWCRMRDQAPPQAQDRGDHTAYVVVVRPHPVQSAKASGS
jgi:TusA-related sulfurtransferase